MMMSVLLLLIHACAGMAKCISKSRKGAGYNTQASYKAIKFATLNIPYRVLALLILLKFLDVLYQFFQLPAKASI
jgi:hypothetical protein